MTNKQRKKQSGMKAERKRPSSEMTFEQPTRIGSAMNMTMKSTSSKGRAVSLSGLQEVSVDISARVAARPALKSASML